MTGALGIDWAAWVLPGSGFAAGALLGLASRAGRFCTHGAIEDVVLGGDSRRLRMAFLGLGVAMVCVFAMEGLGWMDLAASPFLLSPASLVATALGSLAFGVGMALVGTCAFGALARLGSGDMSGLMVTLVVGISGYAVASGVLAPARLATLPPPDAAPSGLAHLLGGAIGVAPWLLGLAAAALLLGAVLADRGFRASRGFVAWGVVIGAGVALGWAGTAWVAAHGFEPVTPRSISYVRPLGETMIEAMTARAGPPGFGVGAVLGVLAGAWLGSRATGAFRWESCDDAKTLRRQIVGAALMGVGGTLAFGCTIGQGLTAASALAASAPVAMAGMATGSWLVLQWMVRGPLWRADRA